MEQADIGVIGLAVMGQNLVLNMDDHGYRVSVFNRTVAKVDQFLEGPAKGTRVLGTRSLEEFLNTLKSPKKILLMVQAGQPVEALIHQLLPLLRQGDILIDGGNSFYLDTVRRCDFLKEQGILFVGTGISGGEEGARHGPSMMPGGHREAWPHLQPLFQAIAAKTPEGYPCCEWVGEGGAGHYVKMVHNGIEYGDMQLICEAYHLLREALEFDTDRLHEVFTEWNTRELDSYLIGITADILSVQDSDGAPLVDKILDVAGQKGTGLWTAVSALELGVPLTLIAEAVFARTLSSMKEERVWAHSVLPGPTKSFKGKKEAFVEAVFQALYASKIVSYAQGFMLMRRQSLQAGWQLNYGNVALAWRGGCIIRSRFLGKIKEAYDRDPDVSCLLVDDFSRGELQRCQKGWRQVVATGAELGIPLPSFSAALSFYDGYRAARLPANLLQAQRDYFGAHTYERVDRPRGEFFHTQWQKKPMLTSEHRLKHR